MKGKITHIVLYVIVLIGLFFPIIQQNFKLFEEKPLMGYFETSEFPKWKTESWFNGEFQDQFLNWYEDNLGFKSGLTRIHNQIKFSLFQETSVQRVIIGKENFLFEDNYIEAYFGNNYVGLDKLRANAEKLAFIQDTLQKQGKDLLVVIAPNKARFYEEYLPNSFSDNVHKSSNYNVIRNELLSKDINHIDFNSWFLEQKESSPYLLYPQCGIHWTVYGMSLAADSMIQYLNDKMGFHLPRMEWGGIVSSQDYRYPDYDIADAMNLLWKISEEELAYPEISFKQSSETKKPKCIVLGDSYYNSFIYEGYQAEMFELGGFWYYNDKVYKNSMEESVPVSTMNFNKEIEETELFVFLFTEPNIHEIGFGFVEQLYKHFNTFISPEERRYLAWIDEQIDYIRSDEVWMKAIEEKANLEGRDFEDQLRRDAQWAVDERLK